MKFLFGSVFGILLIVAYAVFLLAAAVAGFDTMWDATWLIKLPVMLIVFGVFPWILPFFSALGLHDGWGHNWFATILIILPWFLLMIAFAVHKGILGLLGIVYFLRKR